MPIPVAIMGAAALLYEALVGHILRIASMRGFGWLAANATVAGVTLAGPAWVKSAVESIQRFFYSLFLEGCGIELDQSDPFSDASLCGAIKDKTGVTLRTLRNQQSIKEDVEHWAMAMLEEKTGLHIRNIRDKDKTKKDLLKFASPVVATATGLPLSDISDVAKTKEEVMDFLQDRALVMLSENLTMSRQVVQDALSSTGVTLERLIERIEKAGGYTADGRPAIKVDLQLITLGIISRALLNADLRRRQKEAEFQQCNRREEQLRAGLKRFRDKHGTRMTYERV